MTTRKKAVLLKVLLLGDSCVGKTSIFHRFVKDDYSETYKATIGADFYSKEIRIDDTEVILQMWDTAGQERYQSLGTSFFKGSDACILVYDITSQESFDALTQWVEQFLQGVGASEDPKETGLIFVVLGNKSDLKEDRQAQEDAGSSLVSTEVVEQFCEQNGCQFFETSAKSGFQVKEAFDFIARQGIEKSDSQINGYEMIALDLDDEEDEELIKKSGVCC